MLPTSTSTSADPLDRLRGRHTELSDVLEGVRAEHELAIYLAHRRGLDDSTIAGVVGADTAEVRRIVAEHLRDEDAATYEEGPSWILEWPGTDRA
ncbi:MAG: hypothetical protein WCA46_26170 [Actinocatenispora sp.]